MKKLFVLLLAALAVPCSSAFALEKTLTAGEVWDITETATLFDLVIAEGAVIRPPENRTVTMTVDGVGTAIAPGHYRGDVVLTVNREIRLEGGADGGGNPWEDVFRAAIYIENGKYVADKSVSPMVTRGDVANADATDIKIISREGGVNGVIVTGDEKSAYALVNPMIILAGNGGDDTTGRGHGIMASGNAEVFIENARLYGAGAHRTAVYAGGHSIVHINDSTIETHSGAEAAAGSGGSPLDSPWHLGITGNCRATHLVESGTAQYTSTHIKSQGWGALSTDTSEKVRLTATDCLIETVESGFGAGSTGSGTHTYSRCTFNVADYGVIIGGNATHIITDRTVVNSERIGVMIHTGTGGRLVIEQGSVLNTGDAIIQVKGCGTDILVDSAVLNTGSGVILQSMANDDPFFASGSGEGTGARGSGRDVNAVFKNTFLEGDIINSDTGVSPVNVVFENVTLTGAITTGTATQPPGPNGEELSPETPELYYLIGRTDSTYCARFEDPYGVSVTLDEKSSWVVDKTSYLTRLSIAKNRSVTAPYGYRLTMTVNGAVTHPNAGTYEGDIVLKVTKL